MFKPTISVIIPVYNQAKYLPDAINSVVKQTVTDWECLIINDGSTDNTRDVVQSYKAFKRKIKYIEQKNKGLASARNKGLDFSSGRYIQFLDADDAIDRTKFEKQLSLLEKTKSISLSYTDYYPSQENDLKALFVGWYKSPIFLNDNKLHDLILYWETEMSIPVHCFLFDARFFKEYRIRFDETLPNHEDWDCWMKIFRLNPEVYFVSEKLATYRMHSSSLTKRFKEMGKGYIKALSNQRKSFKKSSYEYNLLSQKISLTRRFYRISFTMEIAHLMKRIFSER